MIYKPTPERLKEELDKLLAKCNMEGSSIDAIMTGISGNEANDNVYPDYINAISPDAALLRYKHLFGECYTSSGFALYAAAHCLHNNKFPEHLIYKNSLPQDGCKTILLLNHSDGKNFSITLLKSLCGN